MNALRMVAVALVALLLPSSPLWAWAETGHRLICETAFELLSKEAQAQVTQLVGEFKHPDGQKFESFADACNFPDTARELAHEYEKASRDGDKDKAADLEKWKPFGKYDSWHFLDMPRDTREVRASDCKDDCILTGIAEDTKRLADRSLDAPQRAEALLFLGHWIADLHQPLHVSYADDKHGATIETEGFFGPYSLYEVWNWRILDRKSRDFGHPGAYVKALLKQLKGTDHGDWASGDPLSWANESYAIATLPAVTYCRWDGGSCVSMTGTRHLSDDYRDEFEKVVEDRVLRAAVRLAARIEAALGK